MKKIIFLTLSIFFLINFSIFIDVHGQEGSRDMMKEYCLNNWLNDLVQCADYVPKDYEERKAYYQSQEAEKVKQETQELQEQESERVCPVGSHITTDNQGNQICVDSSGRLTGYPNAQSEFEFGDLEGYGLAIFVVILIIIIAIAAIAKNRGGGTTEAYDYRDEARQPFSNDTKEQVMESQYGRCAMCGKIPKHWEFDHIHGRGDNSIKNCQGLCRDCHQDKTLKDNY